MQNETERAEQDMVWEGSPPAPISKEVTPKQKPRPRHRRPLEAPEEELAYRDVQEQAEKAEEEEGFGEGRDNDSERGR